MPLAMKVNMRMMTRRKRNRMRRMKIRMSCCRYCYLSRANFAAAMRTGRKNSMRSRPIVWPGAWKRRISPIHSRGRGNK